MDFIKKLMFYNKHDYLFVLFYYFGHECLRTPLRQYGRSDVADAVSTLASWLESHNRMPLVPPAKRSLRLRQSKSNGDKIILYWILNCNELQELLTADQGVVRWAKNVDEADVYQVVNYVAPYVYARART